MFRDLKDDLEKREDELEFNEIIYNRNLEMYKKSIEDFKKWKKKEEEKLEKQWGKLNKEKEKHRNRIAAAKKARQCLKQCKSFFQDMRNYFSREDDEYQKYPNHTVTNTTEELSDRHKKFIKYLNERIRIILNIEAEIKKITYGKSNRS